MNTNPLATYHQQPGIRVCDPAAALHSIIDSLGSATPWAMLAICSMAHEPGARGNAQPMRPAPRTVREIRTIAPRSAAC